LTNLKIPSTHSVGDKKVLMEEPYSLNIDCDGEFIQGIVLGNGIKQLNDFPIGNKLFESIEAEIHLQFKLNSNEKKIVIQHNSIKYVDRILIETITESVNWDHYFINYMNY